MVFNVFAKKKGASDERLSYYVIQTEKHTQRTCTSTRFFRKKPGKNRFWPLWNKDVPAEIHKFRNSQIEMRAEAARNEMTAQNNRRLSRVFSDLRASLRRFQAENFTLRCKRRDQHREQLRRPQPTTAADPNPDGAGQVREGHTSVNSGQQRQEGETGNTATRRLQPKKARETINILHWNCRGLHGKENIVLSLLGRTFTKSENIANGQPETIANPTSSRKSGIEELPSCVPFSRSSFRL